MFYFRPLDLDPTARARPRGSGAAGRPPGKPPARGAIDGRGELAGVDGFRDSEHQIVKGRHHRVAELIGVSLGMFCWAEEQREGLAAVAA